MVSVLREMAGPADAPSDPGNWHGDHTDAGMSRMERLPFVLPDFTRLMWTSDAARETLAPRLQRITGDPYGVDSQRDRIARVQEVLPGFASHFWVEDLFEGAAPWRKDRRYALVLLMPGRLLATDAPRAARLRERLRTHCERVLVYAYGDWLSRYGGLDRLVAATGLRMRRMEGPVGLAEIA
jgi:hypothetical protein